MAKASEYQRCAVGYGVITIDNVRIKNTVLEAANSGDSQAQAAIVKRFVERLKELGIITTRQDVRPIYYDSLNITRK